MSSVIDVARNSVRVGERTWYGGGRHEAVLLAALVQSPSAGLDYPGLQALLRRAGQQSPMDRTGVRRLMSQAKQLVDAVLGEGAFANRLRCAPRRQTVGPWFWMPVAGDAWRVVGDHALPMEVVAGGGAVEGQGPGASGCVGIAEDARATLRILELAMQADSLALEGRLPDAQEQLRAALEVASLTPEMRGLLGLRMGRVLKRGGRYAEAAEQATLVVRLARRRGFGDPGQLGLARQLQRRIAYDRDPPQFKGQAERAVAPMAVLDPRSLADVQNLEALVTRRDALELLANGQPEEAALRLHQAWVHCCAAVYWAISLPHHENAENFAFNLGLIQASLHECGDADAVVLAFDCYRLGLQIREDFLLGKDSVWDQIFIGNLWLDHPSRRPEFSATLSFGQASLASPDFYTAALAEAKRLAEPRQVALSCINLWRFGSEILGETAGARWRQLAREELLTLVRGQKQLLDGLRRDKPELIQAMLGAAVLRVGNST